MSPERLPVIRAGASALERVRDTVLERLSTRSHALLEQEPARVLWEQPVPTSVPVWCRGDGVIVVGDRLLNPIDGQPHRGGPRRLSNLGSWSEVREQPGGRRRWPRLGIASRRRAGTRFSIRSRLQGELYVVLLGDSGQGVVDATDVTTGHLRWSHRFHTTGEEAMWCDWLATTEVGVLDLDNRPFPDGPVRWVEPDLGRGRWALPPDLRDWILSPTATSHQVDDRDIIVTHQADTVAGVDTTRGMVRWKTSLDRYATLLDVQADRHLVAAVSLGREGRYAGWLNLSVRSRTDGRHRWNQWWSGDRGVRNVVALCQGAVVTLEGSFLRSRNMEDGELIWSLPVEAVAGMTSDRHPNPRGLPWLNVVETNPVQSWAWLQRSGVGSAFIHARTGRAVPVAGALHLTPEGLVVVRTDNTVRVVALPSETED